MIQTIILFVSALLGVALHSVALGAVTFRDTFTDTNDVALGDHVPDVGTPRWTALNGTWKISSNAALPYGSAPGGMQFIAAFDGGSANGAYGMRLITGTTANIPALLFRLVDKDNWLGVYVNQSADTLTLLKCEAASTTNLADPVSVAFTATSKQNVYVVLNGNSIKVYLSNTTGAYTEAISVTDATFNTATKYGLRGGATSYFDLVEYNADGTVPNLSCAYYVREDGTAAAKEAATSPAAKATSMSVATFNATTTLYPGDVVWFSNAGGDMTTKITIPTSGGAFGRIYHQGVPGAIPNMAGGVLISSKTNVTLRDLRAVGAVTSNFDFFGSTGCITYNLVAGSAANQCVQHRTAASATHYNLFCDDPADECVSCHDTSTCIVYGGLLIGGADACVQMVNAPTMTFEDVTFIAESGSHCVDYPAGNVTGGTYLFKRCKWMEAGINALCTDFTSCGALTFQAEHCVFVNLGTGAYYMKTRTTAGSTYAFYNCLFMNGAPTTAVILAEVGIGLTVKNCLFANCGEAATAANGTWDYNCFWNAGTARGDHAQTTNPKIGTGFCLRPGSSCIGTGTDLSGILTDIRSLIGKDRTSWDIGASVKKHKRNAIVLRNEH